jgi:hypothetical protein
MIDLDKLKTTIAALISLSSYAFGTWINKINMMLPGGFCQDTFDRVLQEVAWIIAIMAGAISVINGIISLFKKRNNKH